MKIKIVFILVFLLASNLLLADNLSIKSKSIFLEKDKELSIFKDNVKVITSDDTIIFSDYAEYNKKKN